jgi:hypothetical protein
LTQNRIRLARQLSAPASLNSVKEFHGSGEEFALTATLDDRLERVIGVSHLNQPIPNQPILKCPLRPEPKTCNPIREVAERWFIVSLTSKADDLVGRRVDD